MHSRPLATALLAAALLIPSLAMAQEAYPPQPSSPRGHSRDSWYIGFGLGGGNGSIAQGGTTDSLEAYQGNGSVTNVFLNFKVGATLSPRLLLGFDGTAFRSATDRNGVTTALQINNYDAVVTFFPAEQGFFVRGGLGLTALSAEVSVPGFGSASSSVGGGNVIVGVGYAWWLGQHFNLSANLDLSAQSYGSSTNKPESSRFWALWLGCDWY